MINNATNVLSECSSKSDSMQDRGAPSHGEPQSVNSKFSHLAHTLKSEKSLLAELYTSLYTKFLSLSTFSYKHSSLYISPILYF